MSADGISATSITIRLSDDWADKASSSFDCPFDPKEPVWKFCHKIAQMDPNNCGLNIAFVKGRAFTKDGGQSLELMLTYEGKWINAVVDRLKSIGSTVTDPSRGLKGHFYVGNLNAFLTRGNAIEGEYQMAR